MADATTTETTTTPSSAAAGATTTPAGTAPAPAGTVTAAGDGDAARLRAELAAVTAKLAEAQAAIDAAKAGPKAELAAELERLKTEVGKATDSAMKRERAARIQATKAHFKGQLKGDHLLPLVEPLVALGDDGLLTAEAVKALDGFRAANPYLFEAATVTTAAGTTPMGTGAGRTNLPTWSPEQKAMLAHVGVDPTKTAGKPGHAAIGWVFGHDSTKTAAG